MSLNPNNNIPSLLSTDSEWISWHKQLKSYYGGWLFPALSKEEINIKFLQAFNNRAGDQANTYALKQYAESQGFSIDRGISGVLYDPLADTAGGVSKGIGSIGVFVALAVILVAVGIGFTIFQIMKD